MGFLLGIVKWLFSDISNIIIVILAGGLIVFYIGWRWEKMEADKYQKKAIEYEAAFEQQKAQTALCIKNRNLVLDTCKKNEKTSQGTLSSCEKFLRICENKKEGDKCLDKDTLDELGVITDRFNSGMLLQAASPAD